MLNRNLRSAIQLGIFLVAALLVGIPASAKNFADTMEDKHGGAMWNSQKAVSADIQVHFGGNLMIDGRMVTDTPVGKTRFELKDGTVLVFDGQDAWTAPSDSAFQGTRFHVLTWPYFLAAPMKLNDPGTHMKKLGKRKFKDGKSLRAGHLSFGDGVGDSPDDWYIVYRGDKGRLAGMAYIVTFGKSTEDAEKEPHAITYHDYKSIDGVSLATRWQFWNWNETEGVIGEPIGSATLSNIQFVNPSEGAFKAPKGARKEAAPAH